nr:transposase (putative), gypsy type [Tanacetum cinerariifolium]
MIRDPAPVTTDFNAQDYAILVAHPSPFRKFPKAFLCLVGLSRHYTLDEDTYPRFMHKNEEDMDLFAFIHAPDPTKVRVVERERDVDEPRLLDTTVGRIVPLLLVAPDRADSELEASVERLFDEGGSGNQMEQGDSVRGRPDVDIQPIVKAANIVTEDAAPVQLRRQEKRKSVLLAGDVLNTEVGVAAIPTLPFVTASVSTMPEHEDEGHTDSMTEPNLCTIRALRRFVVSSDSSQHSGTNVVEAKVDSLIRSSAPIMKTVTTTTPTVDPTFVTKEKVVEPSLFGASSTSAGGTDSITVYVPQWSVTNGSRLDDGRVCREMVNEFSHLKMRVEYNTKEKRRLKSVVDKQAELLKALRLRAQASEHETFERPLQDETNALKERNVILEKERDALDVNVTEVETFAAGKERELSDLNALFYPYLLTTISGRRWLLTHGMKLAITKCLKSPEYLSALGAVIGKALEKVYKMGQLLGLSMARKSNKDVSVEAVMEILPLEDPVAEKLGLNELQPNVDQLMVPIYSSPDKAVIGATALSLALDASSSRVRKIWENIASHESVLRDVFVPLAEPFSTTALTDDYEFVDADDQAVTGGDAASFPNVDDAELRIP